jgi:hypothetical protein
VAFVNINQIVGTESEKVLRELGYLKRTFPGEIFEILEGCGRIFNNKNENKNFWISRGVLPCFVSLSCFLHYIMNPDISALWLESLFVSVCIICHQNPLLGHDLDANIFCFYGFWCCVSIIFMKLMAFLQIQHSYSCFVCFEHLRILAEVRAHQAHLESLNVKNRPSDKPSSKLL